MKCMACDREMSPDEIKYNPGLRGKFDLCGTCLDVVKDCFEPDSEEEINEAINEATIESLYSAEAVFNLPLDISS